MQLPDSNQEDKQPGTAPQNVSTKHTNYNEVNMKIGEHENTYFSPNDNFINIVSEKSLASILEAYRRSTRTLKYSQSIAIKTLCPHDIARAKKWQIKVNALELFLNLLISSRSEDDDEAFFLYFTEKTEDWSVMLKEKTSD
ncbi:hypothetical protein [Citrobacter sp. 21OH12SH02A-Citro]|uniref:hypothetical protein n=1 Tax=Citrobacter sp. 21OH12SH02A-Citro TaxID=3015952 RepID=UPI0022F1C384|nr:hypothetical protein [Citrobacter sp. 21OH12SH02A-Citro]WBA60322.1 hypothetical protein O6D90_17195 [Citrobacter sp. 21OH12SH02A-Citro]